LVIVTRIVAGDARGRRLAVPPGRAVRPTSDRAREGLFSTVVAILGDLSGRRMLDLFAGSGAVGLEALSRGAGHVLLVEADEQAARAIRDNIAAVAMPGAQLRRGRAQRLAAGPPTGGPFDLIFADPPYELPDGALRDLLRDLLEGGWVASGALVAVERPSRSADFEWPAGIEPLRARKYGEGTLWYGRAGAAGPDR
jgi:16S rRNA (guanine966-N2)-methyltransferase